MNHIIGYARVSTEEQGGSGLGLAAQRATIEEACKSRGLKLGRVSEDIVSGSTPAVDRPELRKALADLSAGRASGLVVSKLDRLSRSAFEFSHLMRLSIREGWAIICIDLGVDTTTPSGKMIAQVMAAFAEFELDMIRTRTREALAAKKRQGIKLGRAVSIPGLTMNRIVELRGLGFTWSELARSLEAEGFATPRGGRRWYPDVISEAWRRGEAPTTVEGKR